MRKSTFTFALMVIMTVLLMGCGNNSAVKGPVTAADIQGSWKTSNGTFQMAATVEGDTITVYWENGDTKSLYWVGSFKAPNGESGAYTWTSVNDHSKTDRALLAAPGDTKDFTYEAGELRFEASMLGTTSVVRMKKL